MEQIKSALDEAGYDYAVAIATQALLLKKNKEIITMNMQKVYLDL